MRENFLPNILHTALTKIQSACIKFIYTYAVKYLRGAGIHTVSYMYHGLAQYNSVYVEGSTDTT